MEPQYPIRTASRLTSLSLDTLRAWERRYQAVTPARTDRGRLYSRDNIAKLILLRRVVEQGHAIGRVAALSGDELKALLAAAPGDVAPREHSPHIHQLADSFAAFDDTRANRELSRLAVLTPPRDLVMGTLLPLMREAGVRWEKGQMGAAQEHLVSAAMHNMLGSLLRIQPLRRGTPRMLFATLAGDLHDFGILAGAMIAATVGWSPLFLGPNLPSEEIAGAARQAHTAVVVIGNSAGRAEAKAMAELSGLLPPEAALWCGGLVPDDSQSTLPASVVVVKSMEEFEEMCMEAIR